MCNLAAYAGTRPAAPILLELLERQEGLWSGHFSGISTVCGGKVYTARICGDSRRLRRETDAEKLPGTVGIAHSRTPGTTPTAAWSHPFPVGDKLAYCANGTGGVFAGFDRSELLKEMTDAGVKFLSEIDTPQVDPHKALPNGHTLHISELNAQLLARAHFQGKLPLISAMRRMFGESPSEIVALAVAADEDDSVTALRYNQPLMWCRREDGMFLATSALAFPDELQSAAVPIPPCTTLTMTSSRLTVEPMAEHAEFFYPEMKLLEIAGIMSDRPLTEINDRLEEAKNAAFSLGVSRDDGQPWELICDIENDPMSSYGYPSIFFTKDTILVAYYEELGYRPFRPEEQRCKLSIFRRADLTVDRVTKIPLRP